MPKNKKNIILTTSYLSDEIKSSLNKIAYFLMKGVSYQMSYYIKLNSQSTSEPFVIESAPEGKELSQISIEGLNTKGIEQVMPVGLKGVYGFYMDDAALFNPNNKINLVASLLYGTSVHGHPIVGDAYLGIFVLDEEGARLDFMDNESLERAKELIEIALNTFHFAEGDGQS